MAHPCPRLPQAWRAQSLLFTTLQAGSVLIINFAMGFKSLLASLLLVSVVSAQLTGPVGPTTSLASKQNKICNVLDYGGSIGSSDIGPAITSAFTVCPQILVNIPYSEMSS